MISPLKEDVEDDIPEYSKLTRKHRARWKCNRCLRCSYPLVRILYLALWFYYIPFLAVTVNFSIPYLSEKLGGLLVTADPGTMSNEYLDFVASQLEKAPVEDAYTEPSIDELVKMMEAIPL